MKRGTIIMLALAVLFSMSVAFSITRNSILEIYNNDPASIEPLVVSYVRNVLNKKMIETEGPCFIYLFTEDIGYYHVEQRENHTKECGDDGAEGVAPIINRIRVNKKTAEVERYEVISGVWGPF